MAKIQFRKVRFNKESLHLFNWVSTIIDEYQRQGYKLTLRQLYYQLVSRDVIPNKLKEYARLSALLTNARMGGYIDWDAIEDRLRQPWSPNSWETPAAGLDTIINLYELPRMKGQPTYIEVWVEKDALSGVLRRVTREYHIPILVNRGYSSASAMYDAFNRFERARRHNQAIRILYLGDFDPSGVDMVRDVEDRTVEFFAGFHDVNNIEYKIPRDEWKDTLRSLQTVKLDFEVIPIALTRAQIKEYNPPPNPAKKTDSRAAKFISEHGHQSWEVDALRPEVLNAILKVNIDKLVDQKKFKAMKAKEQKDIDALKELKEYL